MYSLNRMNKLENIRTGYAVQSPQGAELFEEDQYSEAVIFAVQGNNRWIQPVLLAEQTGRTCQLPVQNGWTTRNPPQQKDD